MRYTRVFKTILCALLVLLLREQSFTQSICTPVFQKIYGGEANGNDEAIAVAYCKSGGMILCGQSTSYSAGQYDAFLLKITDNGIPEWTTMLGGTGNDRLIQVRQAKDGGFIAVGETTSFENAKRQTWV